jgi:hypothetical protein
MVMGVAVLDQVFGDLALGQEGIGRNVFVFYVEGFEEGDGHFDFVGAFGFFLVFYRKGTDFFWV